MTDELDLDTLAALAEEYEPGEVGLLDWDVPEWGFSAGGCPLSFMLKSDADHVQRLLQSLPRLIALCKEQAETIEEWRHNQWDAADSD